MVLTQENLKESKSSEPFGICILNSTANPAQIPSKVTGLAVLSNLDSNIWNSQFFQKTNEKQEKNILEAVRIIFLPFSFVFWKN